LLPHGFTGKKDLHRVLAGTLSNPHDSDHDDSVDSLRYRSSIHFSTLDVSTSISIPSFPSPRNVTDVTLCDASLSRFRWQESPMFMRVVTLVTLVTLKKAPAGGKELEARDTWFS
jgi:hypothetical protein